MVPDYVTMRMAALLPTAAHNKSTDHLQYISDNNVRLSKKRIELSVLIRRFGIILVYKQTWPLPMQDSKRTITN